MSAGEIKRPDPNDTGAGLAEAEFSLARIIAFISNDREQLRCTIHDRAKYNAKYKLREQPEVRGDAGHSRGSPPYPAGANEISSAQRTSAAPIPRPPPAKPGFDEAITVAPSPAQFRRRLGNVTLAAGLIMVALLGASRYRETLLRVVDTLKSEKSMPASRSAQNSAQSNADPAPTVPVATKRSALLPTNFGVYGVGDEKLFALNLLPSRAQDMRIALSPASATSKQPVLANGRVRFVVYLREAALSVQDRAEVRIIAKVARAISYDAVGKPIISTDSAWYIRNISFPYRLLPINENAEMFEIRPEDDKLELSPGRYGLVVKGQVYDFIIGGEMTDRRHCLERMTAANGMFVSECKNL
jgi:hypothetical protein